MLDRLQALADRYEKLSELLCDPDVANDTKKAEGLFQRTIRSTGVLRSLRSI